MTAHSSGFYGFTIKPEVGPTRFLRRLTLCHLYYSCFRNWLFLGQFMSSESFSTVPQVRCLEADFSE